MPGTWLARLGQRYLHGETFALVVSPAIADMQFEAPAGIVLRTRHYLAIVKAFAGALCADTVADLQSLRDDVPAIASLTLLQASYYVFLLLLLSGFGTGTLVSHHPDEAAAVHAVSYAAGVVLVCLMSTAACFWPSRRPHHSQASNGGRIGPDPAHMTS